MALANLKDTFGSHTFGHQPDWSRRAFRCNDACNAAGAFRAAAVSETDTTDAAALRHAPWGFNHWQRRQPGWGVAPLAIAVLSSVDGRHTDTASGFSSAIARTDDLIATALAGAVIAALART